MTRIDTQNLQTAKKNCSVHFPDAPCLIKFEKRETQVYWATCGSKR
jgi:hypothetical protein